jgi:hypothetical protein
MAELTTASDARAMASLSIDDTPTPLDTGKIPMPAGTRTEKSCQMPSTETSVEAKTAMSEVKQAPQLNDQGTCSSPDCTRKSVLCCSKCKSRYYCSKECQNVDYKIHQQLCWDESSDSGGDSTDSDIDTNSLRASFARCEEIKVAVATKNQSSGQNEGNDRTTALPQYPLFNFASRKRGHRLDCFCCTPAPDATGRLL